MDSKIHREKTGKFALKGEEFRNVRSLRLTDSAWKKLGKIAEQRSITRADVVEEIIATDMSEKISQAIELLEEGLTLPPNKGGQIKVRIRSAIALLLSKDDSRV